MHATRPRNLKYGYLPTYKIVVNTQRRGIEVQVSESVRYGQETEGVEVVLWRGEERDEKRQTGVCVGRECPM